MTITFIGYERNFSERPYYTIMFYGSQFFDYRYPSENQVLFSYSPDLGMYLSNKVYSKHMSLVKTVNLIGYIAAQYNKIFDIAKYVNIATLSPNGFRQLAHTEIEKVMSNAEQVDLEMRKYFCDFFVI
jgi:hypothetical protein